MQGAEWARLSHPFPAEAFGWHVVELSSDRTQARLAPYLVTAAVRARLDEVCGPAGWSFQLAPLGSTALVCNLTVAGVTRAAVAQLPAAAFAGGEAAAGAEAGVLAEVALSHCLALFGVTLPAAADDGWVDFDPEANEPLFTPLTLVAGAAAPVGAGAGAVDTVDAVASAAAQQGPAAPLSEATTAVEEPRPDGHLVIDRLLERLKAEGLGKEAAKLVVTHHGYGRTPEEGRELYRKLRELLLEKKEVAS